MDDLDRVNPQDIVEAARSLRGDHGEPDGSEYESALIDIVGTVLGVSRDIAVMLVTIK